MAFHFNALFSFVPLIYSRFKCYKAELVIFFVFYKNQFNEPTKCQAHLKQFEIASKHGPKCINLNHSILFVKISFEQLGTQEKLLPASTIDDRTTHINKYAHLCRFFLFT